MRLCPIVDNFDIETLLSPLGSARFFQEQWEKNWCVLRASVSGRFAGLLEISDIEQLLVDVETPADSILLVGTKSEPPIAANAGASLLDRTLRAFDEGATILIKAANRRLPHLAMLASRLEKAMGLRVHLNVYLTPAASQGLSAHYDMHDVLVLQTAGTKIWRIGGQPVALPLPVQRPGDKCACATDAETLTLGAGDVLYIPRGVVHEAWSTDDISLHITVGLNNPSYLELIAAGLHTAALRDVRLRRGLPPRALLDGDRAALVDHALSLCGGLVTKADLAAAAESLSENFIRTRRRAAAGSLFALAAPVVAAERFRLQPGTLVKLRENANGEFRIVFAGREIALSSHVRPAIELCLSEREFAASDLPGELNENERSALLHRLLKEGLLQEVR
jgi:ribosomal protein L16 Arg81 hydroxylase